MRGEEEASRHAVLYDLIRSRVKPERDANNREAYRRNWWRFGEPRPDFRQAAHGLGRYIVTPMTARQRFFTFLGPATLADQGLITIALHDGFLLGVLSSSHHVAWAIAAGGRLGVGNDPRYNQTLCFDPFPFPAPSPDLRSSIADVAERLDAHRKAALARGERVTMTGMHNVVEKLRSGDALTAREREIHEIAACGVLRDLHDALDRQVAAAYGWPWPLKRDEILERLVALHDERVEEEARGHVLWLRPDYQLPRFGRDTRRGAPELALPKHTAPAAAGGLHAWPESAVEQIGALQALVAARASTASEAAAAFDGARAELVRRHLDTLVLVGEVREDGAGRYAAAAEPA
jgi:hypothetical protein